jgi:hypothetical protein
MCPFNLATDYDDWSYNRDLAADAVDSIENAATGRIQDWSEDVEVTAYADDKSNDFDRARIIASVNFYGREIELGEDTENEKPYYVETGDGFSMRTDAYIDALIAYAGQIKEWADKLQAEYEDKVAQGLEQTAMLSDKCLPNGNQAVYTGRLIIVDAKYLMPEYRNPESQLVECTHSSGARPDAIGTSVSGKELYSGKSVVYGRHQILGVANPEKLPRWAKLKLGIQAEQPKPEAAKEPEKPKNYTLIKHGQRGEIDLGAFATVAEAKQYAAECGVTNYSVKKLNKESLLGSLDENKAKVARNKAESPPQPKKNKMKEVGD